MKEGRDNPSVRCGRQLPLHSSHRLSSSSCAGVAVGLFSEKSTLYSFLQNARPSAALRPAKGSRRGDNPSVRCGGQLPLHASAASGLRRGSQGRDNPSVRCGGQLPLHSSHRNSFSSYSGVAHGLFYEKAILWPFRKNTHASAASGLRRGSRRRGQPVSLGAMRMRMKKGGG